MVNERVAHYLKPAGQARIPRLHLCLNTEALTAADGEYDRQSWRLASGGWIVGHASRGLRHGDHCEYPTPLDLWADVNWRCRPGKRMIIWCHNLSYHLRIANALQWLPSMGYKCEMIALSQDAGWARFKGPNGTVLMTDLMSWCPVGLHGLYSDISAEGPETTRALPDDRDAMSASVGKSNVIATTVMGILRWVEGNDLGPWKATGPAQSHAAWRRKYLSDRVLVHDDLGALAAEREAMWTGRAEAWRHGHIDRAPLYEYDMSLAYCQIGADSTVPTVLLAQFGGGTDVSRYIDDGRTAVLSRVRVSASQPVVPCVYDGHIVWPVGTFDTVLWDAEICCARLSGAEVSPYYSWVYSRAPAMGGICSYIAGGLNDAYGPTHPTIKRVLKHWARTVIGRCALQYDDWQPWGISPEYDIRLSLVADIDTGETVKQLQLGHDILESKGKVESPESVPQIASWIMSECRARLWHLMTIVGLDHVYYVDTDSLITDTVGNWRLDRARQRNLLPPLHLKGVYHNVTIYGPRMLEVDGQRRWAGIPLRARRTDGGYYDDQMMSSLADSLQDRQHDSVRVMHRNFVPEPSDPRRIHLPDGHTLPIEVNA